MNTTFSKWLVTLGAGLAGGYFIYNIAHHGPPMTYSDFWDLLGAVLTAMGFGAGSKLINKGIDNKNGN